MDINLLPWREEIIEYNKKIFGRLTLLAVILSGVFLIFIYHLFFGRMDYTKSYVETLEIAKTQLVNNVRGYFEYKKIEKEVSARFLTLQQLQQSRFDTVRLLNEITAVTPKGIFLKKLVRTGNQVQISGVANSNLLISQMMAGIEKSKVLQVGSLQKVEKTEGADLVVTQFDLQLTLTSYNAPIIAGTEAISQKQKIGNPIESIQKLREEQNKLIDAAVKQ
jgi:type IV pilus assembly protein PilN